MSKGRIIGGTVAAVLAAAGVSVAHYEGYIGHTYADPVGIPTICFGHTGPDVKAGLQLTRPECVVLLEKDVSEALGAVLECVRVDMTPYQAVALTSFVYNIGGQAFCGSTLVKLANAGDWQGACAQLDRWIFARGVKFTGLVNRRAAERAICEGRNG